MNHGETDNDRSVVFCGGCARRCFGSDSCPSFPDSAHATQVIFFLFRFIAAFPTVRNVRVASKLPTRPTTQQRRRVRIRVRVRVRVRHHTLCCRTRIRVRVRVRVRHHTLCCFKRSQLHTNSNNDGSIPHFPKGVGD